MEQSRAEGTDWGADGGTVAGRLSRFRRPWLRWREGREVGDVMRSAMEREEKGKPRGENKGRPRRLWGGSPRPTAVALLEPVLQDGQRPGG